MIVVSDTAALAEHLTPLRDRADTIAFVPTMGNLHAGHIALVKKAGQRADFVVASIFVNPLQFGPNEDLDNYPRTLAADQEKLFDAGCHLLFAPSVEEMYPHGQANQTIVRVPGVSEGLCGGSRPGHFDGVSTVVSKLFNMVLPDLAVFGQKDFQQLAVIRTMVRDLNMPVQIISEPTVRDVDGLALSSRNGYLSVDERATAPLLYRTLTQLKDAIQNGRRDYSTLVAEGLESLRAAGLRPDYLEIRNAIDLQPVSDASAELVILAAAFLGKTRLIDNLMVDIHTSA